MTYWCLFYRKGKSGKILCFSQSISYSPSPGLYYSRLSLVPCPMFKSSLGHPVRSTEKNPWVGANSPPIAASRCASYSVIPHSVVSNLLKNFHWIFPTCYYREFVIFFFCVLPKVYLHPVAPWRDLSFHTFQMTWLLGSLVGLRKIMIL